MSPPPSGEPRLPWELRDHLGILEALIQTVKLVVTDPVDAYSRLRRDGDLTSPLLFAIILGWIAGFLGQIWSLLFASTYRGLFGGVRGLENVFVDPSLIGVVVTLVLLPLMIVVGVFISSGILHLCLLMVGGANDSPMGFEGTVKVYCYAQVAGLASILPLFGSIVFGIWALVLDVIGFAIVHRTTRGKAIAAVLIPVLFCCLCMGLMILFFGAMIAAILSGASEM